MFTLLRVLTSPISKGKDDARREFILNILLVGFILLASVAFLSKLTSYITNKQTYEGLHPFATFMFVCFHMSLLLLSKKGKAKISSWLLIIFLFVSATYTCLTWGVDSAEALLVFALVIVMSGIIIGSRAAFFVTILIAISNIVIAKLHITSTLPVDLLWKEKLPNLGTVMVFNFTLGVIALVSWLFNREMERALRRARTSEAALRKERDSLEAKVEKRTKELKRAQMEKIAQLYRFAEFGRYASGLFHDLAGPLNLISLNLDRLKTTSGIIDKQKITDIKAPLRRALAGTRRLQGFIQAARKQVQDQETQKRFSLRSEIQDAIFMLQHMAREAQATISLHGPDTLYTFGSPVRFSQLITNLVSNAIACYEGMPAKVSKKIEVRIRKIGKHARIEIEDWGCGIPHENLQKIFEPFFTTKTAEKGTGIGLSLCREIVQKDFKGTIKVKSKKGAGSTFIIEFPLKKSLNS